MKPTLPAAILTFLLILGTLVPFNASADRRANCKSLENVRQKFSQHFDTKPNYTAGWYAMTEGINIFVRMKDTQQVRGLPLHERSALMRAGEAMQASAKTSNEVSDKLGRRSPIAFSARESEVATNRAFVETLYAFACR